MMIDYSASYTACPMTYAQEHSANPGNNITFQTVSGERLQHSGSQSVPDDIPEGTGQLGIL